jgi:lysozyme
MKPRHQITRSAIELIKRFEGFRSKSALLPDGRWTIGYGHTQTARKGAQISEADAEALLIYDLIGVAHAVNERVFAPLTHNQFDALCSFAFNIGPAAFAESLVLRRLNEGRHLQAACAMELWRKAELAGAPIVVDSLVRRRSAEKTLFLTPPGAWPLAPTPLLRPQLDLDFLDAVPREEPVEVIALQDGDAVALAEADHSPPAPHPESEPFALVPPEAPGDEPATVQDVGRHEIMAAESHPDLFEGRPRPALETPGAADWPVEAAIPPDTAAPLAIHRRRTDISTIWGLAAAGLGMVLLGLIGVFRPRTAGGEAGGLTMLDWLVGLIGVGLLSLAAYRMLRRLDPAGSGGQGGSNR